MPTRPQKTQRDFQHTWFIQEWMEQSDPPKRQADMIRDLDWSRAVASAVYNGQQYTQTLIDQLAPWLNAKPYELLMHPAEAMRLRRLESVLRDATAEPAAQPATPIRKSA
jgi:hypothetical protein